MKRLTFSQRLFRAEPKLMRKAMEDDEARVTLHADLELHAPAVVTARLEFSTGKVVEVEMPVTAKGRA